MCNFESIQLVFIYVADASMNVVITEYNYKCSCVFQSKQGAFEIKCFSVFCQQLYADEHKDLFEWLETVYPLIVDTVCAGLTTPVLELLFWVILTFQTEDSVPIQCLLVHTNIHTALAISTIVCTVE